MIAIPLSALVFGFLVVYVLLPPVPPRWADYVAIAIVAGLDAFVGAARKWLERRFDEAICARFGVGEHLLTAGWIKDADRRILLDERAALLSPPPKSWGDAIESLQPLGVVIEAWPAERAKAEWLNRLHDCCPETA